MAENNKKAKLITALRFQLRAVNITILDYLAFECDLLQIHRSYLTALFPVCKKREYFFWPFSAMLLVIDRIMIVPKIIIPLSEAK